MVINVIVIILAIINCATFIFYGVDKIKAVNNEWRISEKRLLRLSILGPFGSYLGMKLFRHKVKKPKFYVGIPFFATVQIVILLLLLKFV